MGGYFEGADIAIRILHGNAPARLTDHLGDSNHRRGISRLPGRETDGVPLKQRGPVLAACLERIAGTKRAFAGAARSDVGGLGRAGRRLFRYFHWTTISYAQ